MYVCVYEDPVRVLDTMKPTYVRRFDSSMRMYVHTYVWIHAYIRTYVCMYVNVYTMYVCIYVHTV